MQLIEGSKIVASDPSQQQIVEDLLRAPYLAVPLDRADILFPRSDGKPNEGTVDVVSRGRCLLVSLTEDGIRKAAKTPGLLDEFDFHRVREPWEYPASFAAVLAHPEVAPHVDYIPELEARRKGHKREELEDIPGRGLCLPVLRREGMEAMIRLARTDPRRRDKADQLRKLLEQQFGPAKK